MEKPIGCSLRTDEWLGCDPSVRHGWKAVDLTFQKFKNIKAFFPSCEASDFWGRLWTDFLHDLRLRHKLCSIDSSRV